MLARRPRPGTGTEPALRLTGWLGSPMACQGWLVAGTGAAPAQPGDRPQGGLAHKLVANLLTIAAVRPDHSLDFAGRDARSSPES
jgi:hypothetical protein